MVVSSFQKAIKINLTLVEQEFKVTHWRGAAFPSRCYQSPDPEKASAASLSDGRKQITQISLLNQDMQFYSVVASSSLPHNIWTINHQISHTTAASKENFGFRPSDGVLLPLIWDEQRNSGLPSQTLACFCLKMSIRIPLSLLHIFCKDGCFWYN